MNFDHVNKVSDYVREKLMPHMRNLMSAGDFGNYLTLVSEYPSCKWMRKEIRVFPIGYFLNPEEFMKRHAKKCVFYTGTGNPQEGAIHIVYQISPTMHVLARLYHWVENDGIKSYLMLVCAFREHEEYLAFFDENKPFRLKGNTEEKPMGFAGMMRQGSGFEDIVKKFSSDSKEPETTSEKAP